jgi:hypothetical protein
MNQKRKLGVAETGAGVAVLICLLVVFGYLVLHYFGGTAHAPAVEIRPGIVSDPLADAQLPEADEQPQVLTIESSDAAPAHALRTPADSAVR